MNQASFCEEVNSGVCAFGKKLWRVCDSTPAPVCNSFAALPVKVMPLTVYPFFSNSCLAAWSMEVLPVPRVPLNADHPVLRSEDVFHGLFLICGKIVIKFPGPLLDLGSVKDCGHGAPAFFHSGDDAVFYVRHFFCGVHPRVFVESDNALTL